MRLEVGKQVSPKSIAHKGIDLDGLVHTMNEARGRSQIIIRSLEVRDLLSHNDNDPLQESGVSVSVACMPAPLLRVVCRRSRRYNAVVSTGVAGVGDVTCPHIATKERRHEHALRR